jgi:hypothetical protein
MTTANDLCPKKIGAGFRAILRDWTKGIGFGGSPAGEQIPPAKTSFIPARIVV